MLVNPYWAKPFQLAGICLQRMELTEQCEVYYRLALALEPDDPRTLVYFGEVLIYLGRRDDGLQMIEKASNLLKDQNDPDKLGERAALLKHAIWFVISNPETSHRHNQPRLIVGVYDSSGPSRRGEEEHVYGWFTNWSRWKSSAGSSDICRVISAQQQLRRCPNGVRSFVPS